MFSGAFDLSSKNPDPFCKVSDTLRAGQASALCLLLLPPLTSGSPTRLAIVANFQ